MNRQKLIKAVRDLVTKMCSDMSGGGVYFYSVEYEKEIENIVVIIEKENPNAKEIDSPELPVPRKYRNRILT